jgi:hypothetical protein
METSNVLRRVYVVAAALIGVLFFFIRECSACHWRLQGWLRIQCVNHVFVLTLTSSFLIGVP